MAARISGLAAKQRKGTMIDTPLFASSVFFGDRAARVLLAASTVLLAAAGAWAQTPIWGTPSTLTEDGSPAPSPDDIFPRLATDGKGNWIAAWVAFTDPDDSPLYILLVVSRSTDNGATWLAPQTVDAQAAFGDDPPTLSTDGKGAWLLAWSWTDPLAEDTESALDDDSDILEYRSSDNGVTWSEGALLNANAELDESDDFHPVAVSDGRGGWVSVWGSLSPAGNVIKFFAARSDADETTWTRPERIGYLYPYYNKDLDASNTKMTKFHNSGHGLGSPPDLATDGRGNWLAAWGLPDPFDGDGDIFFARSTDNGKTWRDGGPLDTTALVDSSEDFGVKIASNGGGTWIAAWTRDDRDETIIPPGEGEGEGEVAPDGEKWNIVYARSTNKGETWTDAMPVAPATASEDNERRRVLDVSVDSHGHWVVLWESTIDRQVLVPPGGEGEGEGEPEEQTRYDIGLYSAVSADLGDTWTATPEPVAQWLDLDPGEEGDEFPNFGGLSAEADDDANWIVAWSSNIAAGATEGVDYDIFLSKRLIEGEGQRGSLAAKCGSAAGGSSGSGILGDAFLLLLVVAGFALRSHSARRAG